MDNNYKDILGQLGNVLNDAGKRVSQHLNSEEQEITINGKKFYIQHIANGCIIQSERFNKNDYTTIKDKLCQ